MTVVTFEDFTPPPRHDGRPWSQVRIEESSDKTGPWTLIELLALSPVDSDPSTPATRSFTTEAATLEAGWYRIIFVDQTGDEAAPSDAIYNAEMPSWAPTVYGVAQLLRARTKDANGNEVGDFNNDTRPTDEGVREIIWGATQSILVALPSLPDRFMGSAGEAAKLLAAMNVELSYWPEQVERGLSPYTAYERRFTEMMRMIKDGIKEYVADPDDGDPGGAGNPVFSFPENEGGMVGWGSRW